MKGVVFAVGVGPGDPELITLKALRIIQSCDAIAVPGTRATTSRAYGIVLDAMPEIARKEVLALPAPMTYNRDAVLAAHRTSAARLEALLNEGKDVAFLTIGDPAVYSTFSYLQRMLAQDGYATSLVSGVPSFCAAAACLGAPLVEGASNLHVLSATTVQCQSLNPNDTYVFLKVGPRTGIIKEMLRAQGRIAYAVENCGTASQRVYPSIDKIPNQMSYFSLIVSPHEEGR